MTGFGAAEAKNQSAVAAAASPQQQLLISLIKAAGVDGNGSSTLKRDQGPDSTAIIFATAEYLFHIIQLCLRIQSH